jgi:2,4-dienoyl-CoA reductase-like NADH-dependent reductase (Old Yellow Enzyme family)/thioredoxin reductase
MSEKHFPHLFKKGKIGNLTTKNRIVMLPMARQFQGLNGEVTQKTIDYFTERAKGDVGLIIIGSTRVFPPGHKFHTPASLNIGDNRYIPGHCDLVEALHAHGAKVSIQFGHIGGQTHMQGVAASDVQQYFCDGTPYTKPIPITRSEIWDTIDLFAKGAVMAKTAGYDMVEIHAAHDYLLGGFLSPLLNTRTDEFGGSLENRTRILVEMLKAIKTQAGNDFPVCVRISAIDYLENSIDLDESPQVAKILEAAGADVISVSAGCHETQHLSNDTMRMEEDFKRPLFEAIKKVVNVPIIVAGGYRNPDVSEKIVSDGVADFLGIARPLLADPEWAQKAYQGRADDIRKCLSCGECLYVRGGAFNFPQSCAVNAVFGREGEWTDIEPAPEKKTVMVVGGGPAGMEAARIASLRGHFVTLYEKGNTLGGQLLLAANPPGKNRILWIRDYLANQLEKQGVKINFGVVVTPELIAAEKPDELIMATGAIPKQVDITGSDTNRVVLAWDVLRGDVTLKNQKAVVVGGSMMACETAEFMASRGNEVSVIKMRAGSYMAEDCEPTNRRGIMDFLQEHKVKEITDHKFEKITGSGVDLTDNETGKKVSIEAAVIVLALGSAPVRELADALEEQGVPFRMIGDCCQPKNIKQAIYQGALAGRQV